jgi:predicted DNA-binding protein
MIRTNIHLPKLLLEQLRALAAKTDMTVAEHIRRAIEAYLKQRR